MNFFGIIYENHGAFLRFLFLYVLKSILRVSPGPISTSGPRKEEAIITASVFCQEIQAAAPKLNKTKEQTDHCSTNEYQTSLMEAFSVWGWEDVEGVGRGWIVNGWLHVLMDRSAKVVRGHTQ